MKAFCLFIAVFLGYIAHAGNFYLSNSGNDSNSGLTPSDAWQTLDKLNQITDFKPGDSVLFRRGDTFHGSISIHQGGALQRPIVFGTFGTGTKPVITGFTTVSQWVSTGNNIWESSNTLTTQSSPNVMAINGMIAAMGRYPNAGWNTIASSSRTSVTDPSIASGNWTGAEVVIRMERWVIEKDTIISQSGSTLNFAAGYYFPKPGWGYFIQNSERTLDLQNEWFYNPATRKLKVFSGNSPANVQVSTVDTLVRISNRDNITFDNLQFLGANKNAVYLQASKHITIQNCDFQLCGYEAVYGTWGGSDSDSTVVKNCAFTGNLNNCIYLVSPQFSHAYIGYNTFRNSGLIAGIGGSGFVQNTVLALEGPESIVEYNTIDSAGYNGINYNGNRTVVQNNLVTNFCLLKDDGGGIYSGIGLGNAPATGQKVLNNIILNGIGNGAGTPNPTGQKSGNGIYMDDYTANVEIGGNTTANCSNGGIFLHNASFISVHDNTSFNNSTAQLVMQSDSNSIRSNSFSRNIFFSKTATQLTGSFRSILNDIGNFGAFDNNFYARPIDDNNTIETFTDRWATVKTLTLAQWKSTYGKDVNSRKSPAVITSNSDNSIVFEYNQTNQDKVVHFAGDYIDVLNNQFSNQVSLKPFTSVILIKKDPAVILPVRFSTLRAYQKTSGIQVDWTVQQNVRVSQFEVEKSLNGQEFTPAGIVKVKNNSTVPDNYNWFDPNPKKGDNFYRLKIVDQSGAISYSNVVDVRISNDKESFDVYPNPIINSSFILQLNNVPNGVYTLNLISSNGKLIYSRAVTHPGGSASQVVTIPGNIPPGNLFVRVTGKGRFFSKQLIR